jgi:hypothetical protein
MRQPTAALAAAVLCASVVGCASSIGNAESPTPTPTMIPRPLVERELTGLLLNPDQVNAAMGTTGMAVTSHQAAMSDNSATMAPPECLAIDGAAEAPVYADSGFWAERDQSLNNGDKFTHYLKQAVVLFPTIEKAEEFFNASAERWPACREYTHTQSGTKWAVGADLRRGRGHTECDCESTRCSRSRLGLRTSPDTQEQHHRRRQHMQR